MHSQHEELKATKILYSRREWNEIRLLVDAVNSTAEKLVEKTNNLDEKIQSNKSFDSMVKKFLFVNKQIFFSVLKYKISKFG
jgi:hypothetical protein